MPVDTETLNASQRDAVLTTEGPLLVLAGAGSGKTRVLTYRIAHMVEDCGIRPWQVLAITFTNKAAAEMRERLGKLLPGGTRGMWICTFHAMCVRILREDGHLLGYSPNFAIYDDDDSKRLVRQIMEELELDNKRTPLAAIRSRISAAKNALVSADELEGSARSPLDYATARVYRKLDERLARANAMDFDDLLVRAWELLSAHPDVLARYQERFRQISVDEYQDTNRVQYLITKLLAARYRNLMVVGDDDQSIYSWRGADIRNILEFERDYPEAKVVKLEENYRSTGHILAAANAVVAKNSRRKPKRLYTSAGDGELIRLYQAADERDEGRWIGAEIEKLHDAGTDYEDIAVFVRTNAQTRVLEDMLLRAGVPYRLVAGTRFFDRAEIRDVMAYLKLVVNPADDIACQRVINTPRRGIGASSIAKISGYAQENGLTFFEAAQACIAETGLLTPRVRNGLADFCGAIEAGRHVSGELAKVVEAIIDKSGLVVSLAAEHSVEADARIENIHEFINVAAEFDETHDEVTEALESLSELREAGLLDGEPLEGGTPAEAASPVEAATEAPDMPATPPVAAEKLPAFLEWLALRSELDSMGGHTSAITIMTVHAAKGLEFPVVFVAGLEEGLFPHMRPDSDAASLEEERRLAYVAITRAERKLYLTHAATRRTWGTTEANPRSRFVGEIPPEHIKSVGVGSVGFSGVGFEKRGDRHGTYGSGRGSEMYGGRVFGSHTRSTPGAPGAGARDTFATPAPAAIEKQPPLKLVAGDCVSHKTFGPGVVVSVDGDKLQIKFTRTGKVKMLLAGFAPIVKVE